MFPHGVEVRADDAAEELSVASRCGGVHVNELPRGVTNDLNQLGRSSVLVVMSGLSSFDNRRGRNKTTHQRQT